MSFGLRCLKELEQPLLTRLRLKSTFCLPSPPSICVVAVSHLQSTEAVSHVLKHDHRVWQITGPQGSHHDWCAPLSLSCLKKKKKEKKKEKKKSDGRDVFKFSLGEWHISWRNESCLQWGPLSGPWPYIWKHCVLLCVSQLPPVVWSYWLKWRRGVCVCIDWA